MIFQFDIQTKVDIRTRQRDLPQTRRHVDQMPRSQKLVTSTSFERKEK